MHGNPRPRQVVGLVALAWLLSIGSALAAPVDLPLPVLADLQLLALHDGINSVPATLLLLARRLVGQVATPTDPAPVEMSVWRLDRESRWSVAAPYASLPPAERLAADIAADGERAVLLERLWPDQRVFESLLGQVETGDPQWLRIAVSLRSVSDAGVSEGLNAALSTALAKQPENVLRVLATEASTSTSTFTVADVCSGRFAFIEQPVAETRWRGEARGAVAATHDERLAQVRDACLAALPPAQ